MTSNDFVASRQRSDTPASLSLSSIPAQNAARRETLARQYSLLALLIERGVRASDHGVSTPLPTRDLSPIILAFRSLREGAGSSTIAAAAAWHLGTRRESRVLAVAPQGTFSGFRTLFNLPPDVRPSDIFWRYTDSIFIAFTPDKTENNYSSHPPVNLDPADLCDPHFTHVVVDLGHVGAENAQDWRGAADLIVTVAEPDAHTAVKLSEHTVARNELVLFNKALSFSESHTDVMQFLRATPGLSARIAPQIVPRDEFAARAALQRGPVTQLAPFAESAQAIAALSTWLILRAARLREEVRC